MKKYRKQLIVWLFEHTQRIYTRCFKNHAPWNVTKTDLLQMPTASFGWHLGDFLDQNNFELIPKVERHDCYHVLCNFSTKVEDEIALQCLCFGNGKRSIYLYGAIVLGVAILPDYFRYYYSSNHIGKRANRFHHYDYQQLLNVSIADFRSAIFTKSELSQLNLTCLG